LSWNYTGRPEDNDRDKVRFLTGDTCESDKLLQDEEIAYALSRFSKHELAAALCLRSLAARYSRMVSVKVGDVSVGRATDSIADAYMKRVKELDPFDLTVATEFAKPRFGGLSISEKESLNDDSDAVQPSFSRGMNDIPDGPGDGFPDDYGDLVR
jgi:hypothetical protein